MIVSISQAFNFNRVSVSSFFPLTQKVAKYIPTLIVFGGLCYVGYRHFKLHFSKVRTLDQIPPHIHRAWDRVVQFHNERAPHERLQKPLYFSEHIDLALRYASAENKLDRSKVKTQTIFCMKNRGTAEETFFTTESRENYNSKIDLETARICYDIPETLFLLATDKRSFGKERCERIEDLWSSKAGHPHPSTTKARVYRFTETEWQLIETRHELPEPFIAFLENRA